MKLLFPRIMLQVLRIDAYDFDMYKRMFEAPKFIFESVADTDAVFVKDIHETAEEMMDFGIFRLPSQYIWVEDPVNIDIMQDVPDNVKANMKEGGADVRMFYFAEQEEDRILMWGGRSCTLPDHRLQIEVHEDPTILDIRPGREYQPWTASLETAMIALKHLVVTLGTDEAEKRRVTVSKGNAAKPLEKRHFEYTHIKIKPKAYLPGEEVPISESTGKKRKLHFVRGYIWGRHTRPRPEQRWIKPQWRGDINLGWTQPKSYEVEAQ